ncbi:hypothetical protein [Janthinobacterium sp. 17J80-10]|uniref:hypothetical protein n=1 Tax=Janthinobacterium sp. 17J80-10 TaxID=2497863 RepID=UPI0010055B54|nr:hypothetical protein [Janthinobacterium sp. 17J80-10]QAU34006.1 hypothetical protein EKL02_07270 [Janthinobacterium sp. 17J80-10]
MQPRVRALVHDPQLLLLIEDGRVTLHERIELPRPRVLNLPAAAPDSALGDVTFSATVNQVVWAV